MGKSAHNTTHTHTHTPLQLTVSTAANHVPSQVYPPGDMSSLNTSTVLYIIHIRPGSESGKGLTQWWH